MLLAILLRRMLHGWITWKSYDGIFFVIPSIMLGRGHCDDNLKKFFVEYKDEWKLWHADPLERPEKAQNSCPEKNSWDQIENVPAFFFQIFLLLSNIRFYIDTFLFFSERWLRLQNKMYKSINCKSATTWANNWQKGNEFVWRKRKILWERKLEMPS